MLFGTVFLAFGAFFETSVLAQAPNTLTQPYPYDRTMSNNGTYFLVPIDRTIVQAALPSNYKLLPNPTGDTELFPNGFPEGMHPVIVGNSLGANIEMTDFQGAPLLPLSINFLLQGEVYIPFVDRLNDGKTAFQYPLLNLIGGVNGQLVPALAPVLVGSTQGYLVDPGSFNPPSNAYSQLDPSNNPGEFVANSKLSVFPNQITGPGIAIDVFQLDFFPTASSPFEPHTFHSILNQPLILYTGQCLRNTQYFNNTYANPFMTTGTVTLSAGTGFLEFTFLGLPPAFQGTYSNVGGYAATSENVGFSAEDCQTAANNVDTAATE